MSGLDSRGEWTSASAALADSLCPGRHLAQKGMSDERGRDSIFGSRVHDALAKGNSEGLSPQEEDIYESCKSIEQRVLKPVFGVGTDHTVLIPDREKRFWMGWADGLKHSGQLDCAYRFSTRGLIVEYKTLAGDVPESSKNLQLRDQAVLFDVNSKMIVDIAVAVIQPLVTHTPEVCIYKREDLNRARDEMYARVKASNDPSSPRMPGEVQCKFCLAKNTCKQYTQWASGEIAGTAGSFLDTPVMRWTPEMRAKFLERAPIVEKFIDNAKKEMKRLLKEDAQSIPGYELAPGKNLVDINNPQGVFDNFSKVGGTLDQFMKCVSVAKGKLEVEVRSVTKAKGKKLDEAMEAIIGNNVIRTVSDQSIVKKERA